MAVIVQKFGGTSVANPARIKIVTEIIKQEILNGNQVIVVVSAMAGVTNQMITHCSELAELDSNEKIAEYDAALASGEMVASALTALALNQAGFKAQSLQSWQLPIITDNSHSKALVQKIDITLINNFLEQNIIPVITGFQGITQENRLTTLGRGGSVTSAALIAARVKADRCDIYTDVEGVFSADPRIVHDAKKINELDLDEMLELASSGAKVLQSRSVEIAARYRVPLRVLSSFNQNEGTIIKVKDQNMEHRHITAVTSNKNLLNIWIEKPTSSFAEFCSLFGLSNISLNFASKGVKSYNIIANLHDKTKISLLLDDLQKRKTIKHYVIETNIVCVSLIGYGIKNDNSLTGQILRLLKNEKIEVMQISSSETKISFFTNDNNTEKAIKLIHDHFELDK